MDVFTSELGTCVIEHTGNIDKKDIKKTMIGSFKHAYICLSKMSLCIFQYRRKLSFNNITYVSTEKEIKKKTKMRGRFCPFSPYPEIRKNNFEIKECDYFMVFFKIMN